MGLAEITLGLAASVDLTEVGDMNADARAIKGIHPHSAHVNVSRVNGITTVLSAPTGGTISGQAAVINLNGSTPDEMAVIKDFGLVINFPSVAGGGAIDLKREFVIARRPKVLLALLTTVLGAACVFSLFTYIVPILETVSGFAPATVTAILFVIGVGLTMGMYAGGKLADRGLMRALGAMLAALVVLSVVFAAVSGYPALAVVVIFFWGMAAFAMVPPLQTRILDTAKEAPNVASSLNVGAFNLGNAAGAFIGGAVLDLGFGLRAPPIAAAIAAGLGLAATVYGARLDRSEAKT